MAAKTTKKYDPTLLQNQPNVPKGGWQWVWMFDYEQNYQRCQYCGQYPVRYLHILKHPQYPDFIRTGSDCAAYLCGRPYEEFKDIENNFKNYCKARDKFMKETEWTVNKKGNLIAEYKKRGSINKNLTIVQSKNVQNGTPLFAVVCNSKFITTIKNDETKKISEITTLDDAKRVAFDLAYNKVCEWNMIDWKDVRPL